MNSDIKISKFNNKKMNQEDNSSLNINENKNDSLEITINEKKKYFTQSPNQDISNISYSILPINQESSEISERKIISKKKKKLVQKRYFQNICKRKSIIGLCLNLVFWIWSILYILNYKRIIIFPRGSSDNKKVHMVYSYNTDSLIGNFISTLLYTFFTYFIVFIYPEVILFVTYCAYVIYSLFTTEKEKFKDDKFFLSKNTYIICVIFSFGEIYKLFARKYLDI